MYVRAHGNGLGHQGKHPEKEVDNGREEGHEMFAWERVKVGVTASV